MYLQISPSTESATNASVQLTGREATFMSIFFKNTPGPAAVP